MNNPAESGAPAQPGERVESRNSLDRSLSILLVTARYVPEIGGTEVHTRELAERLARRGHRVTVLTTDRSGNLPVREERGGVRILRVRAWPAERDYYLSPGIVGAMRSSSYDVVHIQGYHTLVAPVAMLSAMRSNIPFVLAFHSGGHSSRVRRAMRGPQIRALRPLFGRAHRLVASSASELQYFKWRLGMPAAKFEMVPVLANLPQIADGVQDPSGNTVLVTVGRLEHYKGHQRVIEALPLLRSRVPNLRLRIVGEGPLESRLYQLAREHHVDDLVTIAAIPPTHRREMAEIMQRAALVISLSDFESAGLSIREALSLGRPVLVTDIAGYSDLHGSPLVNAIPLKSPIPVIANAIADSLRRTVFAEAADIPTWDECIDQFERIYRDAIGAR